MDIFTLYVGQGDLTAIRSGNEAIIVDAHMPNCDDLSPRIIEESLDSYLRNVEVRGLILTGLDRDHACPAGVDSILTRYSPDWVMYPTYFKETEAAGEVFATISRQVERRKSSNFPLERKSVRVDTCNPKFFEDLASNFSFELFSPHIEDMDSSNNSSIVLKVIGTGSNSFRYLITGDTESDRWETINRLYGSSLASEVMSAPHHGARSGINVNTLLHVNPDTVLISAGVENSYGHPDASTVAVYQRVARQVYSTHADGGVCLFTRRIGTSFETRLVRHFEPAGTAS